MFIRNRKLFTAFCTSTGQDFPAIGGLHTLTKSMYRFTTAVMRLECTFHNYLSFPVLNLKLPISFYWLFSFSHKKVERTAKVREQCQKMKAQTVIFSEEFHSPNSKPDLLRINMLRANFFTKKKTGMVVKVFWRICCIKSPKTITAALFLKEFVPDNITWLHFDLMAWNLKSRPGRPQGGEAMSLRALFSWLEAAFP